MSNPISDPKQELLAAAERQAHPAPSEDARCDASIHRRSGATPGVASRCTHQALPLAIGVAVGPAFRHHPERLLLFILFARPRASARPGRVGGTTSSPAG